MRQRRLQNHELARALAFRSKQLESGLPAHVKIGKQTDAMQIAKMELAAKRCPLKFRDPLTGDILSINLFMTEEMISTLRLNALSDWDEKQAQVDI